MYFISSCVADELFNQVCRLHDIGHAWKKTDSRGGLSQYDYAVRYCPDQDKLGDEVVNVWACFCSEISQAQA